MKEIRASMVGVATIDEGNLGIDGGGGHHRSKKFGDRWWGWPPSMKEIRGSMVGVATIDERNSGIDGGRVHH
jgi:hypothetical protein